MECRCKEQQTKPPQPRYEAVAPAQVLTSQEEPRLLLWQRRQQYVGKEKQQWCASFPYVRAFSPFHWSAIRRHSRE